MDDRGKDPVDPSPLPPRQRPPPGWEKGTIYPSQNFFKFSKRCLIESTTSHKVLVMYTMEPLRHCLGEGSGSKEAH